MEIMPKLDPMALPTVEESRVRSITLTVDQLIAMINANWPSLHIQPNANFTADPKTNRLIVRWTDAIHRDTVSIPENPTVDELQKIREQLARLNR